MTTPAVADLPRIAVDLSEWQSDRESLQLHPGDLGWHSLAGAARTAADLRIWSRHGKMVALGLLDEPAVLRMAIHPGAHDDDALAQQIGSDVHHPDRGVLPTGEVLIEARGARSLHRAMLDEGWTTGDPWTPFHYDFSQPPRDDRVEKSEVRVETLDPDQAETWVSVHWSAFKGTPFGGADKRRLMERWGAMTKGPFCDLARHLIAFDSRDNAVAVTTVWSAGAGRPGLIEPMGVHRDHRGRGYGVAITRAGVTALRDSGSSGVFVAAEGSNAGALATYAGAGFTAQESVADLKRPA